MKNKIIIACITVVSFVVSISIIANYRATKMYEKYIEVHRSNLY